MSLFRATLFIALLAAPVVPTVIDDVQVAPAYQERDFLTPRPPAHRRRQARRRGVLVA